MNDVQEQQSRRGSKAEEEEEQESEEEAEVQDAKGNSVFDAPVVNLAAGLQLGFTPSTAGDVLLRNTLLPSLSLY